MSYRSTGKFVIAPKLESVQAAHDEELQKPQKRRREIDLCGLFDDIK